MRRNTHPCKEKTSVEIPLNKEISAEVVGYIKYSFFGLNINPTETVI
jgi:hypothetical protein